MNLSTLNVDVLLYFIQFVDPEDRFNLVLSGILKGFENVNEGIDLRQRIEGFGIELGLRRDGTCQLEIRSLNDGRIKCHREDDSRLNTLERLVERGYFQNNRKMILSSWRLSFRRLFQVISSMTHLEKLNLLECDLSLTQDLPQLFRSCPKLTELHLTLFGMLEMGEKLENELRSGFQRLRLLEFTWDTCSLPLIQEIFTWLKECAQLTVFNNRLRTRPVDVSLTLNPDLSQNLRVLDLSFFPAEFIKWMLPFCPNIHTLKYVLGRPEAVVNEIVRLKRLRDLHIDFKTYPKEIIRNCRQLEILRLDAFEFSLEDLADFEHNKNIREVHLHCFNALPVIEVLPILQRCTHLRRLTLKSGAGPLFPPFQEICDFIMELKQLTFLHFIYRHYSTCGHFKSEVGEVKAFVLPRRPKFKFYFSCCDMFNQHRVSRTTTF